jgi:3-phenylpropionate/trans-cinnamate dioxygenase ferredoxin reductase subunit
MPRADRSVDVLLVGGGISSVRCARALRRHGFDGSVLLVGNEDRAPYNRPPLSKELLRQDLPDELLAAELPAWYARRSIELWTDARVTALDPDARRATFADGTNVGFERCLLATGARLRRLSIPGGEGALMLRTADDARRVRAAAAAAPRGAAVVIIGGGFIGLEVASAMAALGLHPTVLEAAPNLWAGRLGLSLAAWAADQMVEAGIVLHLGSAVTRLAGGAVWVGQERFPAAFVVAGIGVQPRDGLATEAGIATGDGILVDADQRTSHPAVWASGDVARLDGRRVEHWHAAREAGERAALSMLGLPVPGTRSPWVFSEIAGTTVDVFGDATSWDDEHWARDRSVLAYLDRGHLVQLAVIDSALDLATARGLVDRGASVHELEDAVMRSFDG